MVLVMVSWCNVGFAEVIEFNKCYHKKFFLDSHTKGGPSISTYNSWEEHAAEIKWLIDRVVSINFDTGIVSVTQTNDENYSSDIPKIQQQNFVIETYTSEIITAKSKEGNVDYYTNQFIYINVKEATAHREERSFTKKKGIDIETFTVMTDYICNPSSDSIADGDKAGSSGTAFFINQKGNLLTNNHVVEGCKSQKINYFNKEYDVKIIATDKTLDLALLKSEVRPKSFISFSKDEPKKRQTITAAGYPLGEFLSDDLKINDGRISALKGFDNNSNEIQHDIPINPGNSGGPIVNEKGQLVAIAVSGMAKDITEGLNFGIKSSAAANFLKSNKISPSASYMSFSTDDDKLVKLLEESTVYTFCN